MKKIIIWIIVVATIILGVSYLNKIQKPAVVENIKIGFMGPLTGDAAGFGESIKRGVDLAKKDAGLDIEIIYEDSKCEGKDAVNAINKLINADKVPAIVGEVCSKATLAAAPVANGNNVPLISAASTNPDISISGEYIYRTVPSDSLHGAFVAQLVYDKGYRKLAVLYGNEDYGIGFNNIVSEGFMALGGEVVAQESFDRTATDFKIQITKIKAAQPDAVYLISNAPSTGVSVLKQLKDLGVDAAIFASEGFRAAEILEGAGSAAEGMIVTSVSVGSADFVERHKEVYGEAPGPFAAQAYDAFMAIAKALKNGALTGEEIKNELDKMTFKGVTGDISFDENGDVSGSYDVFVVENGEFVQQ